MLNLGDAPFTIRHGDRIAQMVVAPAPQARFELVDALDDTVRGQGGFGSTGGAGAVTGVFLIVMLLILGRVLHLPRQVVLLMVGILWVGMLSLQVIAPGSGAAAALAAVRRAGWFWARW